ncbi:adenylate cyclase [Novosphingobium sp. AP12]|uniref:MoaF-related domain-containing protein n=1 Tax=Novosphingobium sp. AP12 TaxID=1144305 RepID=UPI00030D6B24|nr:adenylate cyclase [Novosphingobium sp. AP12]
MKAINAYHADGRSMTYTITGGATDGATGTVEYEWRHLPGGCFVISWQEGDGATVTHLDDFDAQRSLTFYTTPDRQFYRLEGSLKLSTI